MENKRLKAMEDTCFMCGKKQGIKEPFKIFELQDGHISFCSKKCEEKYDYFQELNNICYKQGKNNAQRNFIKELEILKMSATTLLAKNNTKRLLPSDVREHRQKINLLLDKFAKNGGDEK